jgi:endonuclease/exonuclease/phosphatase (EEP) superfamily protein YafD
MQKRITAISTAVMVTLSGCVSIPTELFTVGQRCDSRIPTVVYSFDTDPLANPQTLPLEEGVELDSSGFSLLNWNMLKGMREGWKEDFQRLSNDRDLLIIQEAYLTDDLRKLLQSNQYNWDLAAAFMLDDIKAGVLTASKVEPDFLYTFRANEPLITIPKTILITRYPLTETDKSLLVANIHSINYSLSIAEFRDQLQRLQQILTRHHGPLIISGDFNTWTDERMATVTTLTKRLGLKAVTFGEDKRTTIFGHDIDHIYYRGLEPVEAIVAPVTTSDHNPMLVTFRLADA